MSSWEPVDVDHNGTAETDYELGNDFMNNLERRLNQLRQFNRTLKESHDKDLIYKTTSTKMHWNMTL